MKAGIIHNNIGILGQPGAKMPFKPHFKPQGGCCPIIIAGSNDLCSNLTANNIQALKAASGALNHNTLSARRAAISPRHVLVNAALIHVGNTGVLGNLRYLGVELFPFFLVSFAIGRCRFFKVIFPRSNASAAPDVEPPKCLAISFSSAWGCSSI